MIRFILFIPQELTNLAQPISAARAEKKVPLESFWQTTLLRMQDSCPREPSNNGQMWVACNVQGMPVPAIAYLSRPLGSPEFNFQDFANTAWAFSTLNCGHHPLRNSIAAAARQRLASGTRSVMTANSQVVCLVGLVQAFSETGNEDVILPAVAAALLHDARELDRATHTSSREASHQQTPPGSHELVPSVIAEYADLCVLWKPPGWTVSVVYDDLTESSAPSGNGGTPAGRALQDWLAEEFGALHSIACNADVAHGLLHRLDRDTSGALLWARTYKGYFRGRLQLAARRIRKEYVCLCHGLLPPAPRLVQMALLKVAVDGSARSVVSPRGRPSCTEVRAAGHLRGPEGAPLSLVELRLHTGRLHQIRAHLAAAGHPLLGDAAYGTGARPASWCPRVFLHACRLRTNAGQESLDVSVPLPVDLREVLAATYPVTGQGLSLRLKWSPEPCI